jgi:hypothetical protein
MAIIPFIILLVGVSPIWFSIRLIQHRRLYKDLVCDPLGARLIPFC